MRIIVGSRRAEALAEREKTKEVIAQTDRRLDRLNSVLDANPAKSIDEAMHQILGDER